MNGVSQVQVHKSTIYLARHGESAANVSKINLPPEEDVLTERGQTQADLLGKHLKDVVFTKAFASTYARANDTANFVLKNSNMKEKPELKIDARIRERELGDYVGQHSGVAFKALYMAVKAGTPIAKFELPGAETAKEFDDRIESFVDDLFEELRNTTRPETILIVSHGITMLRLLSKLREPTKGLSFESFCGKSVGTPMTNTSYHVFTVQAPPKTCDNNQICLDFLHYHQKEHLQSLAEDNVDNNNYQTLASGLEDLKKFDGSIASLCAMQ